MRRDARSLLLLLAAAAAAAALSAGCATMRVQPWDRDLLSEKAMNFNPLPMERAIDDHIYFSKEGSMGGQDASGGGCGCN